VHHHLLSVGGNTFYFPFIPPFENACEHEQFNSSPPRLLGTAKWVSTRRCFKYTCLWLGLGLGEGVANVACCMCASGGGKKKSCPVEFYSVPAPTPMHLFHIAPHEHILRTPMRWVHSRRVPFEYFLPSLAVTHQIVSLAVAFLSPAPSTFYPLISYYRLIPAAQPPAIMSPL
jgi:hypothetical protein